MSLDQRLRRFIGEMRKITSPIVPAVLANDLEAILDGCPQSPHVVTVEFVSDVAAYLSQGGWHTGGEEGEFNDDIRQALEFAVSKQAGRKAETDKEGA
jgi:hypothetical protein